MRLGSFEIGPLLGVGGMGEVYRARDARLGRDVAIKVLPAVVAMDPERRARFEREARVLATLNHPNIASIHGVEEHEGVWALVLELVDGETLADLVERGPVPPAEVTRLASQLIDALDAAHERGIVHRDLKPANIKLTSDGAVKVLDFGLAKAMLEPGQLSDPASSPTFTSGGTRDGVILGTAAYMSPEQARGRAIDKRADIWAFGCVLFELLAARRPFGGESISDVIVGVLEREPPWSALPAGTPPPLRRLMRRCLEKDPKARLRDVGDARVELAGTSDTVASGAVAPPRTSWRTFAAVAAAAAVLTLAGVWLWTVPWGAEPPVFDRVTRVVATSAHEFAPAISPDGKWIAYLSDARGPSDVWVKFIAGGEPVNLTSGLDLVVQAQDYIGGLQISPDGAWIAFAAGPTGSVAGGLSTWVMPGPLGGTPRRLLDVGNQGMTWSADGTRIAYMRAGGSSGDSIWIADSDGEHARQILAASGGRHAHWIRLSHDGRYVYFNRGWQNFNTEPTELFRVPVDGGAPEPVVRSLRRAVFGFPDVRDRGLFYAANPDSTELTLWWRDLARGRDFRLFTGAGDYGAPYLSADNSRLVTTLTTGHQHIVRANVADAAPVTLHALSDPLSGDIDPAWSPDGTRVAFSSLRGGNRNLWTARPDLTGAAPLTSGTALDERPAYAPDGREIAFVSDRGGQRGVWLVSADGGTPRLLSAIEIIGGVSWSRDGKRLAIAVPGADGPTLALLSRETGKVEPLPATGAATSPVWSPTEDVIAYLETQAPSGTIVHTTDPQGKPVDRGFPKTKTPFSNGFLSWSRDGHRLAAAALGGSLRGSLWIADPAEPVPYRKILDLPSAGHLRGVTWSPDGTSVLAGVVGRSSDIVLAERRR